MKKKRKEKKIRIKEKTKKKKKRKNNEKRTIIQVHVKSLQGVACNSLVKAGMNTLLKMQNFFFHSVVS